MDVVCLLVSLSSYFISVPNGLSPVPPRLPRGWESPLIIGLTIVSMGTSAPELVVSVKAAMNWQSALSIEMSSGSNLFNVGVILGISALIYPLAISGSC